MASEPVNALERRTFEIGRSLFEHMKRAHRPWHRAWWDTLAMNGLLGDPAVKVQLFRFIDALPSLRSPREVVRHLDEYLAEAGDRVPWLIKGPLALAPPGEAGDRMVASLARHSAEIMAKRFIAGSNPAEALVTVKRMRHERLAFTADLLGEAVTSEREADAYRDTCLELLTGLHGALAALPEIPIIDRDHNGPIPRVNLSLKLSSLTAQFDPLAEEATSARVLERLRPILRQAREVGAFVNVDMEQYSVVALTHAIFRQVLAEPGFADWDQAGIVVQAYLRGAMETLEGLRDWVETRGVPITIRLVKGAYWDYEVVHARQNEWPIPVYTKKWETDLSYERCARFLIDHREPLHPAFGSHNLRSLAAALAMAEEAGAPAGAIEVQVLHGMGAPIARSLVREGRRVRVYMPYGAMLPGMAYLVRRLLENTSNESFLKASASGGARIEDLLQNPEETGRMSRPQARERAGVNGSPEGKAPVWPAFANEPPLDFSQSTVRTRFREVLANVAKQLPLECPLRIGSETIRAGAVIESRDPGNAGRLVARATRGTVEHANAAVAAAAAAFAEWSATAATERAALLRRVARVLREHRVELAAWEVYECAKPWREADGDLCEAIDFCEYYARQMVELASGGNADIPGETNDRAFTARGVIAVIPPWNFPLAIPIGMTAAAIVAGNTVVLKPAEQSPGIAWQFARAFEEAGLPPGVLNYLPGVGEEVGPVLVDHPDVAMIAFTGSRAVGLEINRRAAVTGPRQTHVKRVIAEMGGKNAIIVDDDADLDEAVVGILYSAFGYAGQKCSACSRLILLDGVHDALLGRLVEAAKTLAVGPAENPDTDIPPVIDAEAKARIERYRTIARQEGRVALDEDWDERLGACSKSGNYVGPLIVADVDPKAAIAQEEVFGPILAVLRAKDMTDALRIALDVPYALTGGIYSRSPANIARARQEFLVGNLYINRPITGAIVNRQPFGGFKLSGIGTKAGGPDYLREFVLPRTITENTLRRGFVPEVEEVAAVGE